MHIANVDDITGSHIIVGRSGVGAPGVLHDLTKIADIADVSGYTAIRIKEHQINFLKEV